MIVWEVNASNNGSCEHIARFHNEYNALQHFIWCLQHYESATPPYEVEDDGEYCMDDVNAEEAA